MIQYINNHNHNYEENQEIVIKRPKKHENKPIRVSIISKETPTQVTTTTMRTTTEKEREIEEKKKYVQVQSFNNKTNLLFELNNEESGEDYDLSSMEISAMVEELKKFEERPHPLDFPDHPEHDSFGGKEMEELRRLREEKRRMSQQQQHPNNRQNARRPPPQQSPRQPQQPHPLLNTLKMAPPPITTPCDHFTPSICLQANNYPTTEIQNSLENSLLRPPPENINNNHHDNAINPSDSGFLCPSKVAYGRIKKAKSSSSNNWKFVVNHGDYSQTLRIEKCLTPGASCSYVMPIYRTSCTQVYNYHRLLAWDEFKGLHLDVFKIPTVCTCHISGYYQKPPQSPQRRRLSPYPQQRFRFPQQPVPQPPQPQQPREDPELSDLLKQYGNLRDKIQKKTSTQRMLKKLNYIETVLLRKKRKNENNPENLKKFLRKLKKKNKKLNNQELLKLAKRKLRMLPHSPKKQIRQSKSLKSLNVKKSSRMFRKLLNRIRRGN